MISEQEFNTLVEKWRKDTCFQSNNYFYITHDSINKIKEMGEEVYPLIFKNMEKDRTGWWIVLSTITGVNINVGHTPIKEVSGWIGTNVAVTSQAWLDWAKENGYLE